MRTVALIGAYFLAACTGDAVSGFPVSASSASGEAGGPSSTSSAGGTGGSGAGGSSGSAGGGGEPADGGAGSGGRPTPNCPPPACPPPGGGWNCDPTCGPVEPWCDTGQCSPSSTAVATLPLGFWDLRLPPVAQQHAQCGASCGPSGPLWEVRIAVQDSNQGFCIQWDLPESGYVTYAYPPVDACTAQDSGLSPCDMFSLGGTGDFHMYVGIDSTATSVPDGGATIRFFTSFAGCGGPPQFCDGGCNGDGDRAMN
jgi:hypothetical protein